ncbi:hypothetical protein AHAS_Ahas14G0147500 [Arachis hypogaea]
MCEEKKVLVNELEFSALRHIPSLNVIRTLLKELAHSFDLYEGSLDTRYREIKITLTKIKDDLCLMQLVKILFCNLFYQSNFDIIFTLLWCY